MKNPLKAYILLMGVLVMFLWNPPKTAAQEQEETKSKEEPIIGLAAIPDFQPRLWVNVPAIDLVMPNGVAELLYGKKRLKLGLGGGYEVFRSDDVTFNRAHVFLSQMYYFSTPDYYGYYVKLNEGMPLSAQGDVEIEQSWYLHLTAGLKGSLENKIRFFVELGIGLNYLDYQFSLEGSQWSDRQEYYLWRPVLNFGISL